MKFIKLTDHGTEKSIYLNMDIAQRINPHSKENFTYVDFGGDDYNRVNETPEQILKLINHEGTT